MHMCSTGRRFAWWLVAMGSFADLSLASFAQGQTQKQVLVLYETRRDAQIVTVGDREIPRILEDGAPGGLDYYAEFIDQVRFSHADYQREFRDFLRLKYQNKSFDLVIAVGDIPLEFIDKNRDVLFPESPVVFFSTNRSPLRPNNATGITTELNLSDTLTLAAELQPDARHVFVVSGNAEANKTMENQAREQFRSLGPRFDIVYLSGLRSSDLERRLASLPERSIVYYLVVDRDGENATFHPLEYLDRVVAAASAPVYCWVDSAIDHGIVGGSVKDQALEVRALATLGVRVLRGEKADHIPIATANLNVRQVDWRQLQRWNISESRVPAGTLIRFKEPSALVRYRPYIWGTVAVLFAQMALIAGLLVQRKRRKEAEEKLRSKQVELIRSHDRIRDMGSRLLHAQEGERSRIALELHDDISQQLAVLTMDLAMLRRSRASEAKKIANDALKRAGGIATSLHELSHRLHPANLRVLRLVDALDALRREMSRPGVEISFTHDKVPSMLSADLKLCLFRLVQEGLQNALKHSDARHVSVDLNGGLGALRLSIVDNGVGFDVDAAVGKGLGLMSMRERLESIGASLEIHSAPGVGTRLKATVPFEAVTGIAASAAV